MYFFKVNYMDGDREYYNKGIIGASSYREAVVKILEEFGERDVINFFVEDLYVTNNIMTINDDFDAWSRFTELLDDNKELFKIGS